MPVRDKILIVVGGVIVLLLIVAFIAYPLFQKDELPEIVPESTEILPENLIPLPSDQEKSVVENTTIEPIEQSRLTDEQSQRAEIERLSRLFIERFGSYSNYSDFENITSLDQFMSSPMRKYARSLMEEPLDDSFGSQYYGVTTRLLSIFMKNFVKSSQATVEFVVQQEIQEGVDSPIETMRRDGRIELKYSGEKWLVDGVYYQ